MNDELIFIREKEKNINFFLKLFFCCQSIFYFLFTVFSLISYFSSSVKNLYNQNLMYILIFVFFFIILDFILSRNKHFFYTREYIKFDDNKNMILLEKDYDNIEKVIDIISCERLIGFTYFKICSCFRIDIEGHSSLDVVLDEKSSFCLLNKITQMYPDKHIVEDTSKDILQNDDFTKKNIIVYLEDTIKRVSKNWISCFLFNYFSFADSSTINRVFIKFDECKNIILYIKNKYKMPQIIKNVYVDDIKCIKYKKTGGFLQIELYDSQQIEIRLEFLSREEQTSLVNIILHNYMDKITPVVIKRISKPHQIGESKNVLILTIIGVLIVVAIIVFAIT